MRRSSSSASRVREIDPSLTRGLDNGSEHSQDSLAPMSTGVSPGVVPNNSGATAPSIPLGRLASGFQSQKSSENSSGSGESSCHEGDHGFVMVGSGFVVSHAKLGLTDPGERPLHHRDPGSHVETGIAADAFDYLNPKGKNLFRPSDQSPWVAAVAQTSLIAKECAPQSGEHSVRGVAAVRFLPPSHPRVDRYTVSVSGTVWEPMIAAVGQRSRPVCPCVRTRSTSCTRCHTPAPDPAYEDPMHDGGNPAGSCRHAIPLPPDTRRHP